MPFDNNSAPGLEARLRREIRGEILFDRFSRGRYATDASIYQIEPLGVVIPKGREDAATAIAIAREEGVPVLPRGGGHLAMRADGGPRPRPRLQPAHGPDRLGRCRGAARSGRARGRARPAQPRAAAAQAVLSGRPVDREPGHDRRHDRQQQLRLALVALRQHGAQRARHRRAARRRHDGVVRRGPRQFRGRSEGDDRRCPSATATWCAGCAPCTGARPTRSKRRFPQAAAPGRRLQHRHRSTMAATTWRASWSAPRAPSPSSTRSSSNLQPIPAHRVLGICHFPSFYSAMAATRRIVELGPSAVELVDRTMIDLSRDIPMFRAVVDRFVQGEPAAVLLTEFAGDDPADNLRRAEGFGELMGDLGLPGAVVEAIDPAFQAAVWEVRAQGLNIMMSMKGDGKPISFLEDCAVRLEDLADYTERLTRIFEKHGTYGTWYAHASVGCLHVRPVLNVEAGARGQEDAGDRRGSLCHGPRIQGLAFGRARRRAGALGIPRGDVRRAPGARLRGGQGRVRPARAVQSRQDRAALEDGRP